MGDEPDDLIGFEPFDNEPEKKSSSKDEKEQVQYNPSADLLQLGRRIKIVEEGINNLRKKMLVDEQNDLNRHKKSIFEYRNLVSDINEIKKEMDNLKRVMKEFISELRGCARHEEVDVLKKYVQLWDPLKFATEETVQKMIEEKIKGL
jgi:SepF-like predicted cell division protein (DUF552 family)